MENKDVNKLSRIEINQRRFKNENEWNLMHFLNI